MLCNCRKKCSRSGGAVLEMCLALPVLVMLSFGIVDYGYFLYVKNTLQGAAEAGARAAVAPSATNTSVTTIIASSLSAAGLQNSGYTVAFSPSDISTAAAGSAVTVTVNLKWGNVSMNTLSAGYGGISSTKQIVGAAVMMKESS